jgi:hypothetical protein
MRPLKTLPVLVIAMLFGGCASPQLHAEASNGAQQQPDYPDRGSSEARSTYGGRSYGGKGHVAVNVGNPPVVSGLGVRPDVLRVAFRYQALGADPDALHLIHAKLDELATRAKQGAAGPVNVKVRSIALEEQSVDRGLARFTVVDGSLEVGLPETLDHWARAEQLITLNAIVYSVVSGLELPKDAKAPAPVQAAFERPVATLRDPEPYREELVKRWVARARSFATLAASPAAPLELVDCTVPSEIQVSPHTLDEVELKLALNCSLDDVQHVSLGRFSQQRWDSRVYRTYDLDEY